MEMSPQYAEETARHAAARGYELEVSRDVKTLNEATVYRSTKYHLVAPRKRWSLEVLTYEDGELRYFLEIEEHHGLRCRSFPLHSWKYRDSHIELRFPSDPQTGLALTFELRYPDDHEITRPFPS